MTKTTHQKDFTEVLPNWVPEVAQRYLMHTESGKSIREIARLEGLHASTVLRQIRRIETRRDDPLFDAALKALGAKFVATQAAEEAEQKAETAKPAAEAPAAPSETHLKSEARRILRRLCETGAVLAVAKDMEKAIVVRDGPGGTSTRTASVDAHIAQAMALKEWISSNSQGRITRYRITQAGRTALEHLLADDEHRVAAVQNVMSTSGADMLKDDEDTSGRRGRSTRYNLAESPLATLARRRDKEGKPFLTDDLVSAGERLREDFELSQMGPRVTQNWDHFLTSGSVGKTSQAGILPGPSGARKRVKDALTDLGPGLSDVVLRCCCFLEGLEAAEKKMGWSARSGKIVLRIALIRLKRHYDEIGQSGQMIG